MSLKSSRTKEGRSRCTVGKDCPGILSSYSRQRWRPRRRSQRAGSSRYARQRWGPRGCSQRAGRSRYARQRWGPWWRGQRAGNCDACKSDHCTDQNQTAELKRTGSHLDALLNSRGNNASQGYPESAMSSTTKVTLLDFFSQEGDFSRIGTNLGSRIGYFRPLFAL